VYSPTPGSTTQHVSDHSDTSSTNGYGPVERDRSNGESAAGDGRVLTLNGTTYAKGLGAHAVGEVRVPIPAGCTTFSAVIGVDDEVGSNGSVIFTVLGDSTTLFTSAIKRGADAGQLINVDMSGRSELRLALADGGDNNWFDHADWADAKLVCGGAPPTNRAPTAVAGANPTSGTAPLTVSFSSAGSSDPDGDTLSYAWDLDGDGAYDDSTAANPSFSYPSPATITVGLRVSDPGALSDTDTVSITVNPAGGGGSTQYLSDLAFASSTNGWGPVERDLSNGEQAAGDGRVLTLNGVTYAKGLGSHAAADIRFAIPSGCTTFSAVIGVDDEVGSNGTVVFSVFGDATSLFTSAVKRGTDAGQAISLDISGRSQLRLVVGIGTDNNWFDHADWADAKLTCG
jgi:PKD repeat protein